MRTTITIDDDVLAAARAKAERERRSVGEVLSILARRGLQASAAPPVTERNGIPLMKRPLVAAPVTLEIVNQLRDELP